MGDIPKPTDQFTWAESGATDKPEPGKLATGYVESQDPDEGEAPYYEELNWMFKNIGQWTRYLEQEADELRQDVDEIFLEYIGRSEAEVEAEAAEIRRTTGGSGALEPGKVRVSTGGDYWEIPSAGIWGNKGSASYANLFQMGKQLPNAGIGNTNHPVFTVNGRKIRFEHINSPTESESGILLPPEPTATVIATTSTPVTASKGDFLVCDNQAYICIADATNQVLTNTTYFETRDSVSRQDLALLESWHELVSDKDFVYPLGNTQYGGTTCPDTGLTLVNGSFTGYDTYSLFGNWQSAGALIGKGLAWSTLSESNKQKLLANPDNGLYVNEAGQVVQIRYQVRVIQGLGNEWASIADFTETLRFGNPDLFCVKPKGKLASITADLAGYSVNESGWFGGAVDSYLPEKYSNGGWSSRDQTGSNPAEDFTLSAGNRPVHIIPIALIQRGRNDGAYHPKNEEGSAKFAGSKFWYEYTAQSVESLADCFTYRDASTGLISHGVSGRPDGLYADSIDQADIQDLRADAHQCTDIVRYRDEQLEKLRSGELRGVENQFVTIIAKQTITKTGDATPMSTNTALQFASTGTDEILSAGGGNQPSILFIIGDNGAIMSIDKRNFTGGDKSFNYWHLTGYTFFYAISPECLGSVISEFNSKFPNGTKLRAAMSYATTVQSSQPFHCSIIGDQINYAQHFGVNVAEDDCQSDNTADWSVSSAAGSLSFASGKYQITSVNGDGVYITKEGLDFKEDHIYQETVDLEPGTLGTDLPIKLIFTDSGAYQLVSLVVSTNRVSAVFRSTINQSNRAMGFYIQGGTWSAGDNIYFKNWRVDDITNMRIPGVPLLAHDVTGDPLLPADVSLMGAHGSGGGYIWKKFKLDRIFSNIGDIKEVLVDGVRSYYNGNVVTDYAEPWTATDFQWFFSLGFRAAIRGNNPTDNEIVIAKQGSTDSGAMDNSIIQIFYKTPAKALEPTTNSEVISLGDITISNAFDEQLIYEITGKVPTNTTAPSTRQIPLTTYTMRPDTEALHDDSNYKPQHEPIDLGGTGPAAKWLYWLSSENGVAYLYFLGKEMIYGRYLSSADITAGYLGSASYTYYRISGGSWTAISSGTIGDLVSEIATDNSGSNALSVECWGDDGQFDVVGNLSTATDLNENTVLTAMKRIKLDKFI